jgi:hypothetical protein
MAEKLVKDRIGKLTGGLIVLYIGIIYLLYYQGVIFNHLDTWWPGILILLGFGIILKYFQNKK